MKNSVFDIFSGLALAFPLAVLAGAIPMAIDSNNDYLALKVIIAALLLAWPWLSSVCMKERRAPRRPQFRRRLIAALLLLPVLATAAMFIPAFATGGVGAAILSVYMAIIAAAMACLGASTAFLVWAFD